MQAPQILGIRIGSALMAFGIFILRAQRDEKRNWVGILAITAFYLGALSFAQNAMFSYAATWSWEGVFYVWLGMLRQPLAPVLFAFLGCLYRPNRVAGYAVMLVAFTGLMMLGSA